MPFEQDKYAPTLLFDGFCVLCTSFAQRLIKRLGNTISVLPMQSEKGEKLLQINQLATLPNEVIFIYNNQLYKGVSAILILMEMSGGYYRTIQKILNLFPNKLLEWMYRIVARNRYSWFGKRDSCYMGNSTSQ